VKQGASAAEDPADGAGRWWDWGLLARWIGVNAAAYFVVVVGASFHGLVLGRWQRRILATRIPGLPRRQWVIATLAPALFVRLLAIAPGGCRCPGAGR
jgi:hypothetical protein